MAEVKATYECLFCPQTFDTAAAKDDHTLEHFAQETCLDCNRNLIRIGGSLYVKHDATICSVKVLKTENTVGPPSTIKFAPGQGDDSQYMSNNASSHMEYETIKIEPPNITEDSNGSIDFNSLDKLDSPLNSEDDYQPLTSYVECKLEEKLDADDAVDITGKCNSFKCDICEKLLKSKKSLKTHKILKHSPDTTLLCTLCAKQFTTVEDRDAHRVECAQKQKLRKAKKSNAELRCDLCDKPFKSDAMYCQHMNRIHKQRITRFKCKQCKLTFLKESWLQQHECNQKLAPEISSQVPIEYPCATVKSTEETKIDSEQAKQHGNESANADNSADNIDENNKIKCEICEKLFSSKNNFKKHKTLKHSPEGTIICTLCVRQFTTIEDRDTHYAECALKRDLRRKIKSIPDLRCDLCNKSFESDAIYHRHMRQVHKQQITKFMCVGCNAKFPTESSWQQHECAIETDQDGQFVCKICGIKMKYKQSIQKHQMAKHSMEIPNLNTFECKSCRKFFAQEISLKNHQCKRKVRDPSLRELIPCETCGKIVTRGAMRKHQIGFHSPPDTIFCRWCFKIFSNTDDLESHIKQCKIKMRREKHLRTESPCDVCGKILSNPGILARHKVSMHSAPGTIFCKTCVKKFETTVDLIAHKPTCQLKRRLIKQKRSAQKDED